MLRTLEQWSAWSEEQRRHCRRGPEAKDVHQSRSCFKNHTHCHHHWIKRRDSESLQAELLAVSWAWLGSTLMVRACDGSEHADDEGLTPGQRREVSLEPAGKAGAAG